MRRGHRAPAGAGARSRRCRSSRPRPCRVPRSLRRAASPGRTSSEARSGRRPPRPEAPRRGPPAPPRAATAHPACSSRLASPPRPRAAPCRPSGCRRHRILPTTDVRHAARITPDQATPPHSSAPDTPRIGPAVHPEECQDCVGGAPPVSCLETPHCHGRGPTSRRLCQPVGGSRAGAQKNVRATANGGRCGPANTRDGPAAARPLPTRPVSGPSRRW